MAHKIILKCRTCLDEFDEEKMHDLFKDSTSKTNGLGLYEKVEFCCGVRIRNSPEMPTKICAKCFDLTRIWFNFRQMCINSQVYLESLCKDRHAKHSDIDDDNEDENSYLEYLIDDLQTFRQEHRRINNAFNINQSDMTDEESLSSDADEDNYVETIPIETVDSYIEIENVLDNIKKEQENEVHEGQFYEDEEEETKAKPARRIPAKKSAKRQKQTSKPPKKSNGCVEKKSYRPPLPTSYMCSICGNVYSKKPSFQYHMSLHSNIKPHECELCGKKFRQVCELKNHMRRHTGEKPYKCSFCDRRFIDRSEKHRHERVHTNTRPYSCKTCGKSFMYSAILKNHTKLHLGQKDFNCLVCQKSFTLQHQLKAHLQTITHKQKETQYVAAGYEVVYE